VERANLGGGRQIAASFYSSEMVRRRGVEEGIQRHQGRPFKATISVAAIQNRGCVDVSVGEINAED
jgi:hypothetical protein